MSRCAAPLADRVKAVAECLPVFFIVWKGISAAHQSYFLGPKLHLASDREAKAYVYLWSISAENCEWKETSHILISTSLIKAIYRVNILSELQLTLNYQWPWPCDLTSSWNSM